MRYFLISFDRVHGRVLTLDEFEDADTAVRARFRQEATVTDPHVEVVVLGAADQDALARTHSRYFGGPDLDELTTAGAG